MSIRGFLRAIPKACLTYRACLIQETPKLRSGGFVW